MLELDGIEFGYQRGVPLFRNISFEVLGGTSFAILGPSGSGKSTIVQLIERFYDPGEGQILIDGVDLRDYDLILLRKKIGLVMQHYPHI